MKEVKFHLFPPGMDWQDVMIVLEEMRENKVTTEMSAEGLKSSTEGDSLEPKKINPQLKVKD